MKPNASRKRGRRYWLNLAMVGLLGGVIMFQVGIIILWVEMTIHPAHRSVCCITPADLDLDYEVVTFASRDGVNLSGWYIPSQNGATVILLHGYGADRREMLGRAAMLAGHGYGLLLYDERAHGESGGDRRTFGWLDVDDVQAALDFLERQVDTDPERIGILGFSIGGQIALRAAAQTDRISAVIADDPGFAMIKDLPECVSLDEQWITFNYWLGFKLLSWRTGVSAPPGVVEVIADIAPRPVFLIANQPEQHMGHRLIRHYYERASEPKTLWAIPEAGHGGGPAARPEEYEEKIVTFFNKALL